MKSDLVKTNMKHSKGVCENDSMSIFEDCSSNELLEINVLLDREARM